MAKESLTVPLSPAMREAMQIRGKESNVDYFALLGIGRDIADEKQIDFAILERSKSLRKWQSSPQHGAEAVKLLTVVHRAGKILKDARRREAYRTELEREERGEKPDAREEFRTLVRAAMADSQVDLNARKELMRYASEFNISQTEAQQVVAEVREEIARAKAAEARKPQEDSSWEFRIAEEGEEGFLLMLAGLEQSGDMTDVSPAALMAQAGKYKVPPERAALMLAEFQKARFKRMVKRVANGGILSDAQVRLLLPKAAAYGMDQHMAYEMIADYTLSARSTEDALRRLAFAQTFSDDDIQGIVENKPVAVKRAGLWSLVPDWLRNLVLIGAAGAALVALVIWLKGNFERPRAASGTPVAAVTPAAGTPVAAATPAPQANTGAPQASPTPEIALDEKPDPPSGMYAFQPAEAGDPPAFELAITEVSRGQYQEYLKATLETPPAGWSEEPAKLNLPVTGITWDKAMAYCKWLAGKQGWKPETVTLPTHAEYLRAALRAKTSKGLVAALGGQTLWKKAKLGNGSGPAAIKSNPFDELFFLAGNGQVYDLIGNVAEWGREAQGEQKAVLGGDFQQTAADFNPLTQRWMPGATASPAIGFRVVHLLGQ